MASPRKAIVPPDSEIPALSVGQMRLYKNKEKIYHSMGNYNGICTKTEITHVHITTSTMTFWYPKQHKHQTGNYIRVKTYNGGIHSPLAFKNETAQCIDELLERPESYCEL